MPVCHLALRILPSRRRAVEAATAEAVALLRDLDAVAPSGGAMSETPGVFWIDIPEDALSSAIRRFPRIGYTAAVDQLKLVESPAKTSRGRDNSVVVWRKQSYLVERLYEEDPMEHRLQAPDKRTFTLAVPDGTTRDVTGYRGDGSRLGRRALPVCDARLLVNLSAPVPPGLFLDPFAGAGGVVIEAARAGLEVMTIDIDPVLAPGLETLGSRHYVGSATAIPLADGTVAGIGTEPPYDPETTQTIADALQEMTRVLEPGGRVAMLCADHQAETLRGAGSSLVLELDIPIDRKGTGCQLMCWSKPDR